MSLLQRALEAIRRERPMALACGVRLIGVVGSVARGEDGDDSDVDVAYDVVGERTNLMDVGGVLMDLRESLGRPVDMVDLRHAPVPMRARLERDLVRA